MNWLLLIVYSTISSGGFTTIGSGFAGFALQEVYATRESCQTALEAYAKKSGASDITLICVEGESFKPVPQRVHPKADKP